VIEAVSLIIGLLIVLTMGGMCFDWIGSGLTDPIYREDQPIRTTTPTTEEVSAE
jgi:hypothetical protein